MSNPYAGEVTITLDGHPHRAKLTLGAMAEMEGALQTGSMMDLAQRFEAGDFTSRDVLALVVAGLRGGGWQGSAADLLASDIAGGPVQAAKVAATLLARAFALPGEEG